MKEFSLSAAAVGTSAAVVDEAVALADGSTQVLFTIANTGVALNSFALEIRAIGDDNWQTLLSGTDWADQTIVILPYCLGAPATLANGAKATALVKMGPVAAIRFKASVAATTTALTIKGVAV